MNNRRRPGEDLMRPTERKAVTSFEGISEKAPQACNSSEMTTKFGCSVLVAARSTEVCRMVTVEKAQRIKVIYVSRNPTG